MKYAVILILYVMNNGAVSGDSSVVHYGRSSIRTGIVGRFGCCQSQGFVI